MNPLWVSVGVTVVLVCVTFYYALETRRIARAAAEQAQELRQQRVSASQPVIWPNIVGWKIYRLEVDFKNIGNGPALNIDIFIGRGDEPKYEGNEHIRYSYMVAQEKETHNFLMLQNSAQDSYGQPSPDKDTLANLAGRYTLLVEWRDLYKSGPFFQAKLPFCLEMDPDGIFRAKEGVVVINQIPEKRIEDEGD